MTPLAPFGGEGQGVRGMSEVRSGYEALLTSDFWLLISEAPLTLYPSPPEGEREGCC
jgi:hypothetical protein